MFMVGRDVTDEVEALPRSSARGPIVTDLFTPAPGRCPTPSSNVHSTSRAAQACFWSTSTTSR